MNDQLYSGENEESGEMISRSLICIMKGTQFGLSAFDNERQNLINSKVKCFGDSRDSGVSENHSRQSSEPFTNSSEEADRHEDLLIKKEKEIIEVLEIEEEKQKRTYENISEIQASLVDTVDSSKIQSIEEQIREQEEVLRVERELLHLEQEEIKRQRENLILRETITRRDLQNGNKIKSKSPFSPRYKQSF
uniref:Uncharacterized protein n=1 Tax=Megaselia scalaris TaxID=36166 RepID=T1GHQ9_MEGSC